MTGTQGFVAGFIAAAVLAGGAAAWRYVPSNKVVPAAPVPPAVVSKTLKEDQIQTIVLRPEAFDRLALKTSLAAKKTVTHSRFYGGEVVIPAGQAVIVSAPVNGTLKAMPEGMPVIGSEVKKGQPLMRLLPLLTPEGRVNLAASKADADGQVKTTQTQLDAAQIVFDRAQRLLKSEAGSKRIVEEAQAQVDLARKAYDAAVIRRDLLTAALGDTDTGTATPLTLEAPTSGLLRNVSATAGQSVPAGATLFEVADLSHVWVRVSIYVGDLASLETQRAAIGALSSKPGDAAVDSKLATAPPTANPTAGTVDLYYELDNRTAKYRPGQRLGVSLRSKSDGESLTVPWSAVVHDFHGGSWVYVEVGERTYARKRVEVREVSEGDAVLVQGPEVGAKVVSAGAAELFGAETGFTK